MVKKKKEKNEIVLFTSTTWVALEVIILNEVSQKEKDKYMISLICGTYLHTHTPWVNLECNPEIPVATGVEHGVSEHNPR